MKTSLPPTSIATLPTIWDTMPWQSQNSTERWNIELFFKWIKLHLYIKSFYSTSENAVYTQIRIAVCSFLILALAKKKLGLEQSMYTISQTLGFVLFKKVPINQLFNKNQNFVSTDEYPNLFSMSSFKWDISDIFYKSAIIEYP